MRGKAWGVASLWGRLWDRHGWWLLAALAVTAFALGYRGFERWTVSACQPMGETWSPMDVVYLALQLFVYESGGVATCGIWQLNVARLLAPAVVGVAGARGVLLLLRERSDLLRLSRFRGHVVICGLGEKGRLLAEELRARGRRVVAIDLAAHEGHQRCRDAGAVVLCGAAESLERLRAARIDRAEMLLAVTGSDAVNAEIAACAASGLIERRTRPLTALIHIADPVLERQLRVLALDRPRQGLRLEFFNIHERGALALWRDHAAFAPARPQPRPPRILIVGAGALGRYLALVAGGAWAVHPASALGPLALDWIDAEAGREAQALRAGYPRWAAHCACTALNLAPAEPAFARAELLLQAGVAGDWDAVYVCLPEAAASMRAALLLAAWLPAHCPIVVSVPRSTGLTRLATAHSGARMQVFPLLERTCTFDLLHTDRRENLARAIHANYLAHALRGGESAGQNPSVRDWNDLPEDLRESNRLQADHILSKLEKAGCRAVPLDHVPPDAFAFTDAEVEMLAEYEHERWMLERMQAGWRFAEGPKDLERKTSPYLVPWHDLGEEIRELDRQPVRQIPALLAAAGFGVYRVN